MPRLKIILEHGTARPFEPFDREAQFHQNYGKSLPELLDEFRDLRHDSVARLRAMNLTSEQLELNGRHPALGVVTPATNGALDCTRFGGHCANQSHDGQAVQVRGRPLGGVSVGNEIIRDGWESGR
jgi:hypothetical protein